MLFTSINHGWRQPIIPPTVFSYRTPKILLLLFGDFEQSFLISKWPPHIILSGDKHLNNKLDLILNHNQDFKGTMSYFNFKQSFSQFESKISLATLLSLWSCKLSKCYFIPSCLILAFLIQSDYLYGNGCTYIHA